MMKNTIFKKVKSIHSKSNSKYKKINIGSSNQKNIKKNSSNKDNIINTDINSNNFNSNNNNGENHTNFLTITIEKESLNKENNNFNSDFELRPINNNNLNLSNKYQIKSKYIFIEKEKNLSPNIKRVNNCINYTHKKIATKRIKGSLMSIKKNKNFCKNIKEKANVNNSHNSNKIFNKIIIEQERQTIKNNNEINNESLNLEKKESFPENDNNIIKTKNKYNNFKLKQREKSLSRKNNKLIIEEEKTIVNDINYINNLNIMDYFHKLSNTAQNNSKKNNSKIIIQEVINDKIDINTNNNINTNLKSNLSKNLINSEKKTTKDNIDIFQNNKLMKQRELNKKINQKKLIGNNIINITENKDKKFIQNQNIKNSKISNKKIIKKNLIKKKKNNINEKEELNQNISNESINSNLFIKNEENLPTNIYKNKKRIKENINNSYFSIMKKKELKEMKSGNISNLNKLNNNLLFNNNSEEKININSNNINNNIINTNNISNSNLNNNTQAQLKIISKKNVVYFSQKSQNKIVNNSTNNIHNRNLVNKDMLKIKINKNNNNKETSIKKHTNRNNSININLNDFKKNKTKRSISPNFHNINNNINNLRHTTNIKNFRLNKLQSNFFLNEIIIDLSKNTNNNNDVDIINTYNITNHNLFNNTTKNRSHKHISPKNTIKTKKIFSSLYSKFSQKENKNLNFINNFNSTYTNNKRYTMNKNNHININVENILNTENKANIINNKEKEKFDIDIIGINTFPNRKMNFINNKKDLKIMSSIKNINFEESLNEIQIPSIPEENIQVIPLKTMKYNNQHMMNLTINKSWANKINKILHQEKIIKCVLLFLSNEDLYNLSLVNYNGYKIIFKLILNIIFNKIVKNINNKNSVKKIWNQELLKYSYFTNINNIDNIYQNYKKNCNKKYDNEIIKDLLRTFPKDSSFQRGSACYQKLFNILKVYSNYNKEIGYAQGMNFIVAKLIKFFDNEKESFIYLDSLFNKLKMVEVIGIKNNLEKKMKTVQFLLKSLCPDILYFLERKKINHEIFTAKWYITLFSKNFKFDNILMIIWNFAIIFGWKFIFLFSIAVIVSFKERYINLDLYDFTQYMKNIFVFEHFQKKFNDVMSLTFSYMSQWKNIIKKMDANISTNKINDIKEMKNLSEKDEEETNDNNENYQDKDKEEIIYNDDYAFT